jgi:two-component system, NtrC family, sensor kinase
MEATTMQQIFEPFFTTKGTIGTGLGLWVCKQLVDKNGGSIKVRSNTQGRRRGTTFSIVFPGDAPSPRELLAEAAFGL